MTDPSVFPSRRRTHSPVADLESHFPADGWRSLFNLLYLKTNGDVVENAENTAAEVDALITASRPFPNRETQ